MAKRYFFTLLLVFMVWNAFSQSENKKLINLLLEEKGLQHIQLSNNENPLFKFKEGENASETQIIVPSKSGIKVLVAGNNKVFEYNKEEDYLFRIDQSKYHGHNFGATTILYNDTLYSIGGYGFWQMNGGVRYFNNNTNEWDIIKGSKLIPFANGINAISYYDASKAKLYVLYHHYNSEYLNPDKVKYPLELAIFDFKTKTWEQDQLLVNKKIALEIKDLSVVQKIEHGLLLNTKNFANSILLNFSENMAYTLKPTVTTELIQLKNNHQNNLIYTKGQSLFLFDRTMDSLFEFKFKLTDFEKTNISIYTKLTSNKIDYTYILIAFAVVILIVINVVVLSTIKKRTRKNSHASELDKRDIKDFVHSLDEIEKIVVKQILENAREQQNTTTNQLNKLLGTDKKEFKIQNNIRSEVILNINKKFKLFSNISDDLIERERAEVDKRFMEYNINKLYLKKINTKMF